MDKLLILLTSLLVLASCVGDSRGTDDEAQIHVTQSVLVEDVVSARDSSDATGVWDGKTIGNSTYPIFLALFKDRKFRYEIPGLGEGTGDWFKDSNRIKLQAQTPRFKMVFEIYRQGEEYYITFSDRHGKQTLELFFYE